MEMSDLNLDIATLGECTIPSPMTVARFVTEARRIVYHSDLEELKAYFDNGKQPPSFEVAGPRERIFFDPAQVRAGIVTCGGLCPGLNDVIRAVVLSLFHHYGVNDVLGFPYGYEGLSPRYGHVPRELTPQYVSNINKMGGTVLGSSRGAQDIPEMVDTLERMKINILFTIGGDGTLRGAQAISEEIQKRNLKISVIGIPKTIDNDISFIDRSFGFQTAGSEARRVIIAAHNEAMGARNGVGLVKLMGRESGFIAGYAALADNQVNFCLVPEVSFTLEAFLAVLKERLEASGHAVVVVAEGAGQELMEKTGERDASGNVRLGDIGVFLRDKIREYFKRIGMELNLKYIDPSYTIRSIPANANDSAFCLLLGQSAVHAGMAGRTNMVVGFSKNEFTHVSINLAVSKRRKIDTENWLWNSVLASTGQPREMR
ncbi:MAG: ATP-dependent 6-phosphofructokinase [Nitrospirota bacterium]